MSALDVSILDQGLARLDQGLARALPDATGSRSPFLIEATGNCEAASQAWGELEASGSAFQSRRWLATWHEQIGRAVGAQPVFLIVRDRAARRPAALFALCVRRRFGVKVVEFPDLGVTDYNAPLCARDLALTDAELEALWAQARLAIPGADVFVFEKLPEAIYGRPMPFARLSWLKPMRLRCWTLALPASRANYDRTALRARDRKEQRRKRRNLVERLGELRLVEAAGDEAAGVFAALKAMRAARFRRQGRRDLLQEPRFARFYEALALRGEPGFVSLVSVSAGEREIAALLGLRHADAYVLIMHSFAADFEPLSPGVVAIDQLMTHLIDSGVGYCDFTTGDESYKKQFGVRECGMRHGLDAVTPLGRLFAAAYRAAGWLRAAAAAALGEYARGLRRWRG